MTDSTDPRIEAEHVCALPSHAGRAVGLRAQCYVCRQRWVLQHAINPDGRTSIRGEWVRMESAEWPA